MNFIRKQMLLFFIVALAGISITDVYAQDSDDADLVPLDPALFALFGAEGSDISEFDLDTGLSPDIVFGNYLEDWIISWNPLNNDATTLFHTSIFLNNAGFDAVAPYHPTAVGVYSRIENRPAVESETNRNPNLATIHSFYQILLKLAPERTEEWRQMVELLGSDPDDTTGMNLRCNQKHNLESPVAIGNLAAKCVLEGREHDGFNHFGHETAGVFMADTTGYTPVNTPNNLTDPSRWQPLIVPLGNLMGKFGAQQFVTPQFANTEPYSTINPRMIRAPPPIESNHVWMDLYKAQTDEVLNAAAHLNDTEKALIEFFDNKRRDGPVFLLRPGLVEGMQMGFLIEMVQFDAGIVAWQEKARYDSVRPITAINHIYGDESVRSTSVVRTGLEIPANQWYSYITTSDHPEYPSGTTCFCAAFAELARIHTGTDTIHNYLLPNGEVLPGYGIYVAAGSSWFEPGQTPAEDMFIAFESWTDYERKCAESRINGGVHFRAAVEESLNMCGVVAEPVYDYWLSLLDGTAPMRSPAQPLDPDPLLDIPHWTGR